MHRRARAAAQLTVLALVLLAVPAVAPAAGAQEETSGSATVTGAGFGHGVGLSQYGARSMAEQGHAATEILQHYYTDVEVEERDVGAAGTRSLRVGLTARQAAWRFDNDSSSARNLHIWLENSGDGEIRYVEPGQSAHVEQVDGGDCEVRIGAAGDPVGDITEVDRAACGDLAVRWPVDGDEPATFVGMPRENAHDLVLARGWIKFVQPDADTVHTVLRIHMEDYLYGLAEVPSSWPAAALQTQAIAGRTFALSRAASPRGGSCSCDLLTTTADQHYTGWAKEGQSGTVDWGARWMAAVDATNNDDRTRGQVVTHAGSLIRTFYSSSSPGTTEDPRDIWGGDVAYLSPVDDSWAHDEHAGNPMSTWTREFTLDEFSQALGFASVTEVELLEEQRLRSGNPGVYRVEGWVEGDDGQTTLVTQELHTHRDLRPALKLPSHGIMAIDLDLPGHFDDVPRDHPFYVEIDWLVDEGITDGYPDGTFRPAAGVARQAAAAFLYRLAGSPAGDYQTEFDDVPDDHPFHDEIAWAHENNLVNGYPDGTFKPGQVVTRQAMAAFLARYEFGTEVPEAASSGFDDVPEEHPFHDEIAWMAGQGISEGYEEGTVFRPGWDVARQATAAFLYRYAADQTG